MDEIIQQHEELRGRFIAFLERWTSRQRTSGSVSGTVVKQVEAWIGWFRETERFTVRNVLRRIPNCIGSFSGRPDFQDDLQVVYDLMLEEVGEPA